ncbi:predicted protein [Naegleria gruberi]|uniref:Predicted protein n=1 Tax=Naegleria gruberi TaxID=5762 RepID=D2VEF4_NAEGR|nr:uncharacterized protein NAEGRDRAFT_67259 [Naegleria gruberi]EFC44867.1 predicted protein [Naegleria gruberi]|eukprot:XP_002677611.1 predicted protein [Naegleria gruberi strain NEG-M]
MDLSQSVLSQASSLFMSALGPEDQDIEISDTRSPSLLVGHSNNLASSNIITNNNHDDPLQKQGAQYETEIQEQFNSLQNYQVNNDRTSLDGYQKLLQKLRQNIQLYELSSSSTSQTQQYKQQLKYYQNRYNVMERQFLLNQHVISSNNEPISNQSLSDDEDEDLEYGRSSNNNALFETERLLRSSDQSLNRSMQLMHEIESSGTESLGMLKSQREQMENTKHKLRGVQGDLVINDRLLNNMTRRKYYMVGGIALMIIIIIVLFALITYGWVNRITN